DQGPGRQTGGNLLAQTLFSLGSKNNHADLLTTGFANCAAQSLRHLGKPVGQPAFGSAVSRTGVDAHDDIQRSQSTLGESPGHHLFLRWKNDEFRCGWNPGETQRLEEIPIIMDLVDERTGVRGGYWIGQE